MEASIGKNVFFKALCVLFPDQSIARQMSILTIGLKIQSSLYLQSVLF
jgi:hypothetical protein